MRKLSNIGMRLALGFLICFLVSAVAAQPTAEEATQQLTAKQYDAAIVSFSSLIDGGAEDVKPLYFNRGLAYYYTQQYDSATADFERSMINDAPCAHCTDVQYITALILEEKGNLEGSLLLLKQIQNDVPDYKDVDKRIKKYEVSVFISKYWYYMIAMALLTFIVIALLSSVLSSKRG
jgi:tetratricopeptide (TPR) repeat protein